MQKSRSGNNMPSIRHRSSLPTRKSTDDDGSPIPHLMRCALLGSASTILSGALFITASCFIAYNTSDPTRLVPTLSLLSLILSELVGGFVSGKLARISSTLSGAVSGTFNAILMLVLSPIALAAPASGYKIWQVALLHIVAAVFCIIGSYLGGIKLTSKKMRKRFGN